MTNGYNDTVDNALMRVGWKQPTAKGYDLLDEDNQASASGRYFNDDSFHTSLTVENIYDCQGDKDISEDDFNAYLRQLVKSNILSALNTVFDAPQFIEGGLLFRNIEATQKSPVTNKGNFVGIRLKVSEGDYAVNIKNALLLLDGDKTFPLYLFHSLSNGTDTINDAVVNVSYIKKWTVTAKANSQTTVPLNYTINGESPRGGVWFLGYFQNDLATVKALDYSPAHNCYAMVGACSFESVANQSNTDFDRVTYGRSAGSYGLNLDVSSYNDLSSTIINNAHLFDNLQGLMMAAKVIELIKNSIRANSDGRIAKINIGNLLIDLNGIRTDTGQWVPGIQSAIAKEIKRIKEAFNKTDRCITYTNAILP